MEGAGAEAPKGESGCRGILLRSSSSRALPLLSHRARGSRDAPPPAEQDHPGTLALHTRIFILSPCLQRHIGSLMELKTCHSPRPVSMAFGNS